MNSRRLIGALGEKVPDVPSNYCLSVGLSLRLILCLFQFEDEDLFATDRDDFNERRYEVALLTMCRDEAPTLLIGFRLICGGDFEATWDDLTVGVKLVGHGRQESRLLP